MSRPSAVVGTVPCNFHLVVHDATHVPAGCRSLSVAWRKGVKEVSTGMVEVQNGGVEWERNIPICSLLFRGAEADGKVIFEAKFCWLEVARDGGQVLGHAMIDLAEFCDGNVHERILPVWRTGGASRSELVGNLRIRISIEARGADLAGVARVCPVPQPLRPHVASDGHLASPRPGGSPKEAHAQARRGSEVSMHTNLETLLRSVAPAALSPLCDTASMLCGQQHAGHASGITPPSVMRSALYGAASMHATKFNELPARLVALCNRQCLTSGLSSMQQEDALELFISALRKRRETLLPCGLIFSNIPYQLAAASMDEDVNGGGAASNQDAGKVQGHCAPPSAPPGPSDARDHREKLVEPGTLPSLTVVGTSATAVDSTKLVCTRHLYELLSHLSDIRSLALTLFPTAAVDCHGAAESPAVAAEKGFSTPSPIGRELSNSATSFVAAAGGLNSIASPNGNIVLSGADASAGEPEVQSPSTRRNVSERCRNDSAITASSYDGAVGHICRNDSAISVSSFDGAVVPISAPSESASPAAVQIPEKRPAFSKPSSSFPAHVMVSQILQAIDQATGIGEQVLKEVVLEFSALLLQLRDMSRDRELWAHRFLASRELQRANELLDQANQIDKLGRVM